MRSLFDRIADRYEFLNGLLTFGMDSSWRRRAVMALALPSGSLVLDVACGTGDVCRELHRQGMRPVGVDFSEGMLRRARTPGPLLQADALRLPFADESFDGCTCAFALRNVADPPALFAEVHRVLRPGGVLSLLEVARPDHPLLALGHRIWFDTMVPLLGGLLSDRAAYEYLPRSTAWLPSPVEIGELAAATGFSSPLHATFSLGVVQVFVARKTSCAPGGGAGEGGGR
ncbi:MAG: ubiquinone/menaquinone biosynthesis C-methyltransferase UbiE [Acidimicrobiales bacterium]|nr:MAG: ubiquinone/menaquinone biosynthesis C-methyltransferase UbiE [Acidimicrobiales bacterium]